MVNIPHIILAGGQSQRMGHDKATLPFGKSTVINHLIATINRADHPFVVVSSLPQHQNSSGIVIQDNKLNGGPLSGIVAGLQHFNSEWAMVVSCDMPFYSAQIVEDLMANSNGFDAVIPVYAGKSYYLYGLYKRSNLVVMEEGLTKGKLAVRKVLEKINVHWMDANHYDEHYFLNMNTYEEYLQALTLLKKLET
jgi:molybdenum cofactor guanylyltransferase